MKPRTTLLLLLLALVLGAAVYWIEEHLPSTRQRELLRSGPLATRSSAIERIGLLNSAQPEVRLELEQGQWRVAAPFQDLAQPEQVKRLLTEIDQIGWLQRLERSEFADESAWKRTGLDTPTRWIELGSAGKPALKLGFGSAAPIEGCIYLRLERPQQPWFFVAKTALADEFKLQPAQWRDTRLLRLSVERMSGLTLERAAGRIELQRLPGDRGGWEMVTPLRCRVGKEPMGDLISALLNLGMEDVQPLAASAEAASGGGDELRVQVRLNDGASPVQLLLRREAGKPTQARVQSPSRGIAAQVNSKTLPLLWSAPNELRDRFLSAVRPEELESLRIESADRPAIELSRDKDTWYMQRHGRRISANGERVAALFAALNEYEVQEFVSDSPASLEPYGLKTPLVRLSWKQRGSDPQRELQVGVGQSEGFFARYADAPSVYRVDASLLPFIAEQPIKWKGLGLLRFSTFGLRRVSLGAGSSPPLILEYDSLTAQWTGQRAGRDVSALIDRVRADRLASMLAKLNVQDWVGDGRNAVEQLREPAFTVEIDLGEPGTQEPANRSLRLDFSPSAPGNLKSALFYGRLKDEPDLFYLSRETLQSLLAPVLRSEGGGKP
jgi:hypothetical protein